MDRVGQGFGSGFQHCVDGIVSSFILFFVLPLNNDQTLNEAAQDENQSH